MDPDWAIEEMVEPPGDGLTKNTLEKGITFISIIGGTYKYLEQI